MTMANGTVESTRREALGSFTFNEDGTISITIADGGGLDIRSDVKYFAEQGMFLGLILKPNKTP